MVPSQAITGARVILNDPAGVTPRWSDATLLQYFNDWTKALAIARGELFVEVADVTLVPGELQSVSKVDTLGIVEVLKNGLGEYVREVDLVEMSTQTRGWSRSSKGVFKVWMRANRDPYRFSVYPPAKGGEVAKVAVIEPLADILIADINAEVPITNALRASAENYIAGRALAVNTNAADISKGTALVQVAMTFAGVQA
jgi:hypothetical protein